MHSGHSYQTEYNMSENDITHCLQHVQCIREKKHLGVVVIDNLKPTHQCSKAKAMSILVVSRRVFVTLEKLTCLSLS